MNVTSKKAVLIIPYYGRLPVQFEAWKHTAKQNQEFDFLFVSDIPEITEEENIHLLKMTIDELKRHIQRRFDFEISLPLPYKLCDYKPAYGFIFQEWIREYPFWGHCDIDVLLGDLSQFLTADVFDTYDKILEHGHLTLYRNNDAMNQLFLSDGAYPEYNYCEVFSSPESFWFDEFYGMMLKSRRLQVKTYLCPEAVFDIDPQNLFFTDVLTGGEAAFFKWQDGHLYAVSAAGGKEREIAYAHFQKRDMSFAKELFFGDPDCVYIFPGCISGLRSDRSMRMQYRMSLKIKHVRDFFRRYSIAKECYSGIFSYYHSRQELKKRRKLANQMLREK